jgi:hypothetical protein
MGYTHYWYRPEKLNPVQFKKFSKDCEKIFHYSQAELGIKLADGVSNLGTEPKAVDTEVCFNGAVDQPIGVWTTDEKISIPWPSSSAGLTEPKADPIANKTDGAWFAGNLVSQRVAPIGNNGKGDGSYETFLIRVLEKRKDWELDDTQPLRFACCKTAYRPYDLTITACLIALKHYFPAAKVSSDGEDKDWIDGKVLCNNLLGYGLEYQMTEDGLTKTAMHTEATP